MKDLGDENRNLKQMFAELNREHKILKDIVEKSANCGGETRIRGLRTHVARQQFASRM